MAEQDMTKYREVFLSEAGEHMASMNTALVALEKNPANVEGLNEIFRASHTLKSMAAAMSYDKTAALCHAVEDLLDAIRNKRIDLQPCADTLYECFDALEGLLKDISENRQERDTSSLIERLTAILSSGSAGDSAAPGKAPVSVVEKVRTIGVKVEKLDTLMNLTEELLINKMGLDAIDQELRSPSLSAAVDSFGRLVTDLQYHVVQARLVPVGFLFNRFPRMVRDLAKQEGKEIDLHTEGSDIELDRTVIDEMGECLVHLLRNAVDHGIETVQERKEAGKNPRGQITLTAKRTRGFAVIEVADDGAGVDIDHVRDAAEKQGILSPGASREEVIDSIFSGISTTEDVTSVSGRGFGLNIVRNRIRSLGGTIVVESKSGQGTRFVMEVPLTLAIIRTLFVEVGGITYGIPVASVDRLIRVDNLDIKGFLDHEAVILDGEDIPLTRLDLLFGSASFATGKQPVVIVRRGDERLALAVDALASTQEVVIKPLNRAVRNSRYFSGSTIIGSGEVVLILDTANLMLSKRTQSPEPGLAGTHAATAQSDLNKESNDD